jgi:hypothetical protein
MREKGEKEKQKGSSRQTQKGKHMERMGSGRNVEKEETVSQDFHLGLFYFQNTLSFPLFHTLSQFGYVFEFTELFEFKEDPPPWRSRGGGSLGVFNLCKKIWLHAHDYIFICLHAYANHVYMYRHLCNIAYY